MKNKVLCLLLASLMMTAFICPAAAADSNVIGIDNIYNLALARSNQIKSNDAAATLVDGTPTGTYLDSTQTVHQLTNVNYQIAEGAQQLLFTYYSTVNQLAQVTNSYNTMQRKLAMYEKMAEIGMMTQTDLETAKLAVSDLKNSQITLQNACDTIKGNIGVFVGYKPEQFSIEELKASTEADMSLMKYKISSSSYSVSYGNSYDIYIAQRAYDLAEDARDRGVIPTAKKEGYALENTKLSHRAAYDSMKADALLKCDMLIAAMDTYANKEKTYAIQSKKYELGMISGFEYEDAKDQLALDHIALLDAQVAFYKSYESFKLFVDKGVWLNTNS